MSFSKREGAVGVAVRYTTAGTYVVKSKAGTLYRIIIGTTAAGAISIYDATSASGTPVAVLKASIPEGSYAFGFVFRTGLTIVAGANSDITVVYE